MNDCSHQYTVNAGLPSADDKTASGDNPKPNSALPLGHNPDSHFTWWAEQGSDDNEFPDSLSQDINQVKDYSETAGKSKRQRPGWKHF